MARVIMVGKKKVKPTSIFLFLAVVAVMWLNWLMLPVMVVAMGWMVTAVSLGTMLKLTAAASVLFLMHRMCVGAENTGW